MKILIVGGVAGGAAFAARARRLNEKADIIMFERGEYVSFANCGLPYYAGDVIKGRDRLLVSTPEFFKARFNVDVRINSLVTDIDREKKQLKVKDLKGGKEYFETYDKVVLSPGAEPVVPPFNGADLNCVHTVRTVPDIDKIKEKLDSSKVKKAVVVGGGFIGIEMAENIAERGIETHIVEMLDQVMPPFDKEMAILLAKQIAINGVNLHLKETVTCISPENDGCIVETATGKKIEADIVIMSVGVKAETGLAKSAGLDIGARGITTNKRMQTNDSDIYAIGDATEALNPVTGKVWHVPLAHPAARQALVAANNVCGIDDDYSGTYGTSIVKVFSLTAAMTGASEKVLVDANKKYEKVYTHPLNHAGYYPGAAQMSIKMLFDPDDGKVLGAQIIGARGVDKRIDVISVAVKHGLTVSDLAKLELSYAPPYGSAKDAVNFVGMTAENHLKDITTLSHWENLNGDEFLLDIRTSMEFERGTVPGAVNIPVESLRERLAELPKDKKIAVFCQVGIRGHIGCRILSQNGYNVVNISGGYMTYKNKDDSKKINIPKVSESNKGCSADSSACKNAEVVAEIDACGLQCPGPIVKLKEAIDSVQDKENVKITSNDIGFALDLPEWCKATGNTLAKIETKEGQVEAVITKGKEAALTSSDNNSENSTIVVFSGDLDKVLASFVIARAAAATGKKVTMFFTFWGLNALKKASKVKVKKDFLSKMFGMMLPSSVKKLKLSNLNMMGIGTMMMKYVMKSKNVPALSQTMTEALSDGIEFVACSMSMDIMGIKEEELMDGIKIGGAAYYVSKASGAGHNLFI